MNQNATIIKQIHIRPIQQKDDMIIATLIRNILKSYQLDIPGTAYYDPELNSLSNYYSRNVEERIYLIAEIDGKVVGGVGFAKFPFIQNCAEIQKLYLSSEYRRNGIGELLMNKIETKAKKYGYTSLYLETHSNLFEAIQLYEKLGFKKIDKPEHIVHTTMDCFYFKLINE